MMIYFMGHDDSMEKDRPYKATNRQPGLWMVQSPKAVAAQFSRQRKDSTDSRWRRIGL